jgi:hypothetical protein
MSAGPAGDGEPGLTGVVWTPASGGPVPTSPSRLVTPAVAASLVLLAVAAATSVGWAVQHGGVTLPSRPAGAVAGATSTAGTGTAGGGAGGSSPAPAPAAGRADPTSAAATPRPTEPPPTQPLTPGPSPTSDRYALLVACPDTPDCYRYTVRSGDNLWSIAHWFGVPLETVYERNPGLRTTGIRRGMQIILPAPTR